jgi:hypothetical protein
MSKVGDTLKGAGASIIAGIIGILPSILKKKTFLLWQWEGPRPTDWKKAGPFSKRQCRLQKAELIRLGCNPKHFAILRPGVTPPPYGGD